MMKGDIKMKELSKYQCEYCKTEYTDKNACAECEANHKTAAKITAKVYSPYRSDKSGYPNSINIEFEDGRVIKYKRS